MMKHVAFNARLTICIAVRFIIPYNMRKPSLLRFPDIGGKTVLYSATERPMESFLQRRTGHD